MKGPIRHRRTLGLLGGMGPAATVDVLDKIIRATPAARDQDHIPILVRCFPQIPDRTDALLRRGPSPVDMLAQGAGDLRHWGADILAIACNTAHHWYQPVHEAFGGPVVHIAEAVVNELRALGIDGPIGVMATRGTIVSGFYQRCLEASGYAVLTPSSAEQSRVDHAVARAKAGDWSEARRIARAGADHLLHGGATRVVLACTELPLALGLTTHDHQLLDANAALARACVRAALGREPRAVERAA
jgi:aspartate racemase